MAKSIDRPKRVKVGSRYYDIEYVASVDADDSLGECDYLPQKCLIKEGQAFEGERDSVIHELFHAVDENQQTDLKEKQVHMLASGVLTLLRDNPKLVSYLCAKRPAVKKVPPNLTGVPDAPST